jgi:hypothetical protein
MVGLFMSIGSGLAFLSIPATIVASGLLFNGGDAVVAAIILGWVGYVMVSRAVRSVESGKASKQSPYQKYS